MSFALLKPMSRAEFLVWEERQELRYEFDGVQPVAMPGGTRAHATIQANLAGLFWTRLRGTPCRFYGEGMKVQAAEAIRYPDGFVACSPGAAEDTVVDDPVVVFKVLSGSTSFKDRILKAREYQATPSIQRYVMLEQREAAATVHTRDGDRWFLSLLVAEDRLEMAEIGVTLPISELYEGAVFPKRRRRRVPAPTST